MVTRTESHVSHMDGESNSKDKKEDKNVACEGKNVVRQGYLNKEKFGKMQQDRKDTKESQKDKRIYDKVIYTWYLSASK